MRHVFCVGAIWFGVLGKHVFRDVWFARIGSLKEMVQICHGDVGHKLRDQTVIRFEVSGWWVEMSVSLVCLSLGRFFVQIGFQTCKVVVAAGGSLREITQAIRGVNVS